jgi:hypothetical protein
MSRRKPYLHDIGKGIEPGILHHVRMAYVEYQAPPGLVFQNL